MNHSAYLTQYSDLFLEFSQYPTEAQVQYKNIWPDRGCSALHGLG